MVNKKIIFLITSIILISGCIGGPTPTENTTNNETDTQMTDMPETIDTTLADLINKSEANLTTHSGTFESRYKYDFSFGERTKKMTVQFDGVRRELYNTNGNDTFVKSTELSTDNTSLSKAPPLNYNTSYDMLYDVVNPNDVEIQAELTDSNNYEGSYTYENSEGEITMTLTENMVIKKLSIENSEAVSERVNLQLENIGDVTISEPSWVQDIRDRQVDPEDIEEVTGEVEFNQNGNEVEVTLVEMDGGQRAIVQSDTGNVQFPDGNELTVGSSITVTNVSTGEPLLVRGIKPNGQTWSIDLYITK